jgi:hypothetical protein
MNLELIKIERPTILLMKQGFLILNDEACSQIGVSEGDCIEFFKDKDSKGDAYIAKSITENKLKLKTMKGGLGVGVNSKNVIENLAGFWKSAKYMIGEAIEWQERTYHTIITRNNMLIKGKSSTSDNEN